MNEFDDDGTVDLGSTMERSYGTMSECLKEMNVYEFELANRPYFEEHIFEKEWFTGDDDLAGFRLWFPIRKLLDTA